jgi:thiol:disulfide interchange protein
MKHILTFLAFFVLNFTISAQIVQHAKWNFSVEKTDKNDEFILVFKTAIDPEWHMYSQFTPAGGPLPLEFVFDSSACFKRIGKVTEPKAHVVFDSTFMVDIYQFDDQVTFKQKVKLTASSCTVTGTVYWQVCKDVCIPGDSAFRFVLGNKNNVKDTGSFVPADDTTASISPIIKADTTMQVPTTPALYQLEPGCGGGQKNSDDNNRGYLGIFIAGMLGGLLALLTPCVFPMIPMTVSFFTKRSGTRKRAVTNAIIYALSIIAIYVSLGLLVTIIFGSDALNDLASNAFFNLSFFIIFIIFAISFFGAFEITLPNWIINRADKASDRGGLLGIFFMAFTLSLVSFSCTGPIIGTLLVEAAHGRSYLGPLAGMVGFSFALAVPFAIFSMFPEWMQSLPKSGGWLNTVKVALGFIELALAFKFLSNVDLAYHWGFLKRELFIGIWVIISLMLGFYLLGKLKLSHDSDVTSISVGRLLVAMITFIFALYLIPGIWGAPLKLISGFPPPDFYKEWQTGEVNECPHDLNCFHDYEEGMRYAKLQGKPVMLDFTGWSCVNCRKMEDNVWSDPKVLKKLRDDYVLISLYVDDKKLLPETEQFVSAKSGKKIRTVGNKWSDMQSTVYNKNAQPYYVLLDNNAHILAEPVAYMPEIDKYAAFLDEGLCRYSKRQ